MGHFPPDPAGQSGVDGSPHLDHWQAAYTSFAGIDVEMNIDCVGNIWSTLEPNQCSQGHLQTPSDVSSIPGPGTVLWANNKYYGNMYFDGYGQGIGVVNSENGVMKYNAVLTPASTFSTTTLPGINHQGGAKSRVTTFDSTKNITAGGCAASIGGGASDNLTFIGTANNAKTDTLTSTSSLTKMLAILTGPEFGPNFTTKQAHVDCMVTIGGGVGYGPVGTGCDHIAQTCSFPDGFTYSRPYALIN